VEAVREADRQAVDSAIRTIAGRQDETSVAFDRFRFKVDGDVNEVTLTTSVGQQRQRLNEQSSRVVARGRSTASSRTLARAVALLEAAASLELARTLSDC
jgi:hypothetical protein